MDEQIERCLSSYQNHSKRFLLESGRKFDLQYSQLYAVRLMALRKKLAVAIRKKWGSSVPIKKISELKMNDKCFVIGTLFKKMELKPNILKEISQQQNILPLPPREKFIDETDILVIEDEAQRVPLTGNLPVQPSVSGTVVALLGYEEKDGKFFVEDFCYCGLSYQSKPDLDLPLVKGEDRYVVIISGLGIGASDHNQLALQLFVDLVTGHLGSLQDQRQFSKVVRIIIAGNSLSKCTQSKENEKVAKYLTRHTKAGSVEAIKYFDNVLVQLGSCVPVDVMPGEFDPANHFMPQQPLHKCMFTKALTYATVQSVSNPYEASIGGVRFLGTSGQNVDDIFKFTNFDDRMDILEHTLMGGHICPTCPDTLSCYPYYTEDPLLLHDCPNIYFAGNQPSFSSKMIKGDNGQSVQLITVPDFSSTSTAVIVNLKDMSCMPLSLGTSF
eukprot:gene8860-9809_t